MLTCWPFSRMNTRSKSSTTANSATATHAPPRRVRLMTWCAGGAAEPWLSARPVLAGSVVAVAGTWSGEAMSLTPHVMTRAMGQARATPLRSVKPRRPPRRRETRRSGAIWGWPGASARHDGELGPAAEADLVAIVKRCPDSHAQILLVELGAVGGPGVDDGPAPVGLRQQHGVQMGDAGVGGRAGQVDLGLEAAGDAAPPDAHLRARQPEPPLGTVARELQRGRVGSASGDDGVEVVAVGGHHGRPRRGGRGSGRAGAAGPDVRGGGRASRPCYPGTSYLETSKPRTSETGTSGAATSGAGTSGAGAGRPQAGAAGGRGWG